MHNFAHKFLKITTLLFCAILFSISSNARSDIVMPIICAPRIVRIIPHDKSSFTQGFFYRGGKLYESTGIYGESSLNVIDGSSGSVISKRPQNKRFFTEGCAFFEGSLYQITWKEHTCLVYSFPDLVCIDTLSYLGEGWGLTSDESNLIMSNGSDTLYFRNERMELIRMLPVTVMGEPLSHINELEYAAGKIYANVWSSNFIFEIDPESGTVGRIIDCKELVYNELPMSDEAVLNGIAYNPEEGFFYITGKNWKNIFVIELP